MNSNLQLVSHPLPETSVVSKQVLVVFLCLFSRVNTKHQGPAWPGETEWILLRHSLDDIKLDEKKLVIIFNSIKTVEIEGKVRENDVISIDKRVKSQKPEGLLG